jgi:hypothetical protein
VAGQFLARIGSSRTIQSSVRGIRNLDSRWNHKTGHPPLFHAPKLHPAAFSHLEDEWPLGRRAQKAQKRRRRHPCSAREMWVAPFRPRSVVRHLADFAIPKPCSAFSRRGVGAVRLHYPWEDRASSMIAALTSGVRPCQAATSSRSATQSRHPSDSPWVQFSQMVSEKQVTSNGTRVQFPPPPLPVL